MMGGWFGRFWALTIKKWLMVCLGLIIGMGFMVGCGSASQTEANLPPLRQEETPLPFATSTPYPVVGKSLPPVDWNKVDHFAAAMRPEYVGDIEPFINTRRYYIEAQLELNNEAAVISGTQLARYTNNSPNALNEIVFRLYPNMPANAARMYISGTQVNGKLAQTYLDEQNTTLWIALDTPLLPNESVEILMDFVTLTEHGNNLSSRAGYRGDQFTMEGWHPTFAPYETNGYEWWTPLITNAVDPNYSETALYDVKITRAKGIAMAISGVTIETTESEDGRWETEHIVTGPMRYSYIAASPVMGKRTAEADGVIVNTYFMPGGERAAAYIEDIATSSVEIYNRVYGDYPYIELDVLELNLVSSAIEYPGLIVLSYRFWQNGNTFAEVAIAHEVAHQWWFGIVGNDQVGHGWIDEGVTTYSEAVYARERYGEDYAQRYFIQASEDSYASYLASNAPDIPLDTSAAQMGGRQFRVIWYDKGRLFYSELENEISQEKVYAGLQSYFQDMKYGVAYVGDILRNMEAASQQELDAFFYKWAGEFEGLDPSVITASPPE